MVVIPIRSINLRLRPFPLRQFFVRDATYRDVSKGVNGSSHRNFIVTVAVVVAEAWMWAKECELGVFDHTLGRQGTGYSHSPECVFGTAIVAQCLSSEAVSEAI
jgi:hypothetical protein